MLVQVRRVIEGIESIVAFLEDGYTINGYRVESLPRNRAKKLQGDFQRLSETLHGIKDLLENYNHE